MQEYECIWSRHEKVNDDRVGAGFVDHAHAFDPCRSL
jgi:hypothetical protein